MLVKNWSEVTRKLDTRNVCRVGRKGDGASTSLLSLRGCRRHPKLRRTTLAEFRRANEGSNLIRLSESNEIATLPRFLWRRTVGRNDGVGEVNHIMFQDGVDLECNNRVVAAMT
ncbi:hypothetical protein CEE36_00340 [candidate division TA06 bacterium B3_TA06]|uniref:Uncharacterized protein n=1 Tax=candidate division TA06 bacterium B3_TA06 TaxID=2012487 RepID=A0A532VAK3_UNCT6|nr:MAG: hypothetical protein CEE36_00340 [candidate division TA06 bacterium B3_TA06]